MSAGICLKSSRCRTRQRRTRVPPDRCASEENTQGETRHDGQLTNTSVLQFTGFVPLSVNVYVQRICVAPYLPRPGKFSLSVMSRYAETAEWIELAFGIEAILGIFYTVLYIVWQWHWRYFFMSYLRQLFSAILWGKLFETFVILTSLS